MTRPTTLASFLSRRVLHDGTCWLVQGSAKHHDYQQVKVGGVRYAAHRWVYEQLRGPIADGLELDHLCKRTNCANPDHLEPVTRAENNRRRMLTGCSRGHDLTAPGSRYLRGNRDCVQCARLRASKRSAA